MGSIGIISALVIGMFLLERLVVVTTTKHPRFSQIYRRVSILHPNGLSILRLPMGFISIYFAHLGYWTFGTFWFAFWMITDVSDGTIARNCDLVTETGKWLDPLSDKFMYFPAMIYLSCGHICDFGLKILPFWITVAFMVVDVLGQCSRLFVKKIAANSFGKAKTGLVTVLLYLVSVNQIDPLVVNGVNVLNERFVLYMSIFCLALAFMSFYCKVIPDCWYANSLILLNALCGLTAVALCVLAHHSDMLKYCHYSLALVFLGQFFDLFDGRLAQKFGTKGNVVLYDEIADAINFGFGVGSILFFCFAYRAKLVIPMVAFLIVGVYLCAMTANLVRARHMQMPIAPGHFCGLPVSCGAGFSGGAVLLFQEFNFPHTGLFSTAVVLIGAALMVSRIPYQHFGQTLWPNMPRMLKLLFCILFLLFLCFTLAHHALKYLFLMLCFALSFLYAILGINWKLLFCKT